MEGQVWPASREDNMFARRFVGVCDGLLREGLVRCHPVWKREGGLEGVLGGMMEVSFVIFLFFKRGCEALFVYFAPFFFLFFLSLVFRFGVWFWRRDLFVPWLEEYSETRGPVVVYLEMLGTW